jgi:hypothetical protein
MVGIGGRSVFGVEGGSSSLLRCRKLGRPGLRLLNDILPSIRRAVEGPAASLLSSESGTGMPKDLICVDGLLELGAAIVGLENGRDDERCLYGLAPMPFQRLKLLFGHPYVAKQAHPDLLGVPKLRLFSCAPVSI